MSLPVMVTRSTCPASTDAMNSLKLNGLAAVWYLEEKFHAKPPSTTRTIQNARLLSVEFTVHFLPTPGSSPPVLAGFARAGWGQRLVLRVSPSGACAPRHEAFPQP